MNPFFTQIDDAHELKRWIWSNAKCMGVAISLLLLLGWTSNPSSSQSPSVSDNHVAAAKPSLVSTTGRRMNPVPPSGWRRTSRGWEHTSTWPEETQIDRSRSLSELVAIQRSSEPKWFQSTLERVSRIPPLMIAVIQVTAIVALLSIHRRQRTGAH